MNLNGSKNIDIIIKDTSNNNNEAPKPCNMNQSNTQNNIDRNNNVRNLPFPDFRSLFPQFQVDNILLRNMCSSIGNNNPNNVNNNNDNRNVLLNGNIRNEPRNVHPNNNNRNVPQNVILNDNIRNEPGNVHPNDNNRNVIRNGSLIRLSLEDSSDQIEPPLDPEIPLDIDHYINDSDGLDSDSLSAVANAPNNNLHHPDRQKDFNQNSRLNRARRVRGGKKNNKKNRENDAVSSSGEDEKKKHDSSESPKPPEKKKKGRGSRKGKK